MLIKFCEVINSKAVSKVYFAGLSDHNLFRGKLPLKTCDVYLALIGGILYFLM